MAEAAVRRKGGRARRHKSLETITVDHRPALERGIPAYDVINDAEVEQVHEYAMRIIEELGVEFRDEVALATWRKHGASVDGSRVRAPRDLIMEWVGHAPAEYVLHARNPDRTVTVGGRSMVFAPSYGPPFVRGLDGVRRHGTLENLNDLQKISHMAKAVHIAGGPIVEPTDVPAPHRHLDMVYSAFRYSDKPIIGSVTAPSRASDTLDMSRIVFGESFVSKNAVTTSLINSNSPLVWDETMLGALRIYAGSHQAVMVSPFSMSGASMPASPLGAVALVTAEVLSAIAYGQMVQPGAPMLYGCPAMTVSLKTGSPVHGGPDSAMLQFLAARMARYYRLPHRGICGCAANKTSDLYAGYDSMWGNFSAVLAGSNWVSHAGGNIEGTLTICYGKTVLDYEQMDAFYHFAEGNDFSELDFVYDTIREVGPGGHFLGAAHTRKSKLFNLDLQNNVTFEQWEMEGEKDALAVGLEAASRWLSLYEDPPMDASIDAALIDYMQRRKQDIPANGE